MSKITKNICGGALGFAAVKAAFAIVLGIVLVFEVPEGFFKIRKPKK